MAIESSGITASGMLSGFLYNPAQNIKTESVSASNEAESSHLSSSHKCQTCANRKYQDGSDDTGVSFQTPTKVDPNAATAKVRSHEQEHVGRNNAKAERDGNEIVSQSVVLHTAICPECGRVYISGGTTRTVTKSGKEKSSVGTGDDRFDVGISKPRDVIGGYFNEAI